MATTSFPDHFQLPLVLETDHFRLRRLRVEDAEQDYEALMSGREHLHSVFGPQTDWPAATMTVEQNREDLLWHQNEFEQRSSFAYTVMCLDESQCVGCVYIYPMTQAKSAFDAQVYLWVRQSALERNLDAILFATVKAWLAQQWPFQNVAFPGREIEWPAWKALGYTHE